MARISIFSGCKVNSTVPSGSQTNGGATAPASGCSSNCCLGRLMTKFRKQSKRLCMATKPTAFRWHYDPSGYSRNFDRSGFGTAIDDEDEDSFAQVYYSFSSRFVKCSSSCRRMPGSELVSSSNEL